MVRACCLFLIGVFAVGSEIKNKMKKETNWKWVVGVFLPPPEEREKDAVPG